MPSQFEGLDEDGNAIFVYSRGEGFPWLPRPVPFTPGEIIIKAEGLPGMFFFPGDPWLERLVEAK